MSTGVAGKDLERATKYLTDIGIVEVCDGAIKALLENQPSNPYPFLADHFEAMAAKMVQLGDTRTELLEMFLAMVKAYGVESVQSIPQGESLRV